MERRQHIKSGFSNQLWMLLILVSLLGQSLGRTSIVCPSTELKAPTISPRVDIGSYESIPNPILDLKRDIFIFWQAIELNNTCDDSFKYQAYYEIITADNQIRLIKSDSIHNNHAKFIGLKISESYNFRLYISNSNGQSEVYSTIHVPRDTEKRFLNSLSLKKSFIKNKGAYALSWEYSGDFGDQLSNYTLFWCENDDKYKTPYQCTGDLNWIHLDKSVSDYIFMLPNPLKTYEFAISANGYSFFDVERDLDQDVFMSSGMIWESCNFRDHVELGVMTRVWASEVDVNRVGLRWKLDCVDNDEMVGNFVIFYCPAKFTKESSYCAVPYKSVHPFWSTLVNSNTPFAYVTNLEPSTPYLFSIGIYTKSGDIINSIPILLTTLNEEKPYRLPKIVE